MAVGVAIAIEIGAGAVAQVVCNLQNEILLQLASAIIIINTTATTTTTTTTMIKQAT